MLMQAWQPIDVDDPDRFGPRYAGDPQALVDAAALLAALVQRPAWHSQAACRGQGWEPWFPPRGASTDPAKGVCASCPVQIECLRAGMGERHGIWGGSSERARRQLRRTSTTVDTAA